MFVDSGPNTFNYAQKKHTPKIKLITPDLLHARVQRVHTLLVIALWVNIVCVCLLFVPRCRGSIEVKVPHHHIGGNRVRATDDIDTPVRGPAALNLTRL